MTALFCIWILHGLWTAVLTAGAPPQAVCRLLGAVSEEALDEEVLEHFDRLADRPLPLNQAGREQLSESGLFTPYQVASLLDWRRRCGDILSLAELGTLDGFNPGFARALGPFVSLASRAPPGRSARRDSLPFLQSELRGGLRPDASSWGTRHYFGVRDRWEAGVAARSRYDAPSFPPETYAFTAVCYGRRIPGKVVAGDYHLRFGQGLGCWSGFSLAGVREPGSFVRRPSGLSPALSYAGATQRGVAADCWLGRVQTTVFADFPGLRARMDGLRNLRPGFRPGVHAALTGMASQASFFVDTRRISADARMHAAGTDFWAEAAWSWRTRSPALLAGAGGSPRWQCSWAVLARWYAPRFDATGSGAFRSGPRCSDEAGLSGALRWDRWLLTADAAWFPPPRGGRQSKCILAYTQPLADSVSLVFRLQAARRRTAGPRGDVRVDFRKEKGRLFLSGRLHLAHATQWSWAVCAESGWRARVFSGYLRGALFRADRWNDRIYLYERDVPGSFTVPACYGRGYVLSGVFGLRAGRGFRLSFRTSWRRSFRLGLSVQPPGVAEGKVVLQWTVRGRQGSGITKTVPGRK